MKILIIGKGGREHALAWKVNKSKLVSEIYCAPGNPGTNLFCKNIKIDENDIKQLLDFAMTNQIDLTIVGPESALELGITNEFQKHNLKIFAPTKEAAKIESSKDFAKQLMKENKIATAKYETFTNFDDALKHVNKIGVPIVLKEDGLKAGKGVVVALTLSEAISTLQEMFSEDNKIVIEEFLEGQEFSLIAMVHNNKLVCLEPAQDYKRAYNDNQGPNTGGMGAYSPVENITPIIINDAINNILKPMCNAMIANKISFTGFLFAGLMLTKDGVKVIEFNARLGDPEAEVILPRMKSDLVEVMLNLLNDKETVLHWDKRTTLGVVLASTGYPECSTINAKITLPEDIFSFQMGTKVVNNELLTNGGRVLIVVSLEENIQSARKKVYNNINKINCDKLFYREDIGKI